MNGQNGISDAQVTVRAKAAVRLAIEKKKITQAPIVIYDRESEEICRINPDGSKTVVGQRRLAGRYSERKNRK